MRVLLITSTDSSYLGGEVTYLKNLAPALTEHGVDIRVLVLSTQAGMRNDFIDNPCFRTIHICNPYTYRGLFAKNLIYPKLYTALRRELKDFSPDVLHFHTVFFLKTVLLATRTIPKVQTFHEMSLLDPFYPLFFSAGEHRTYHGKPTLSAAKKIGIKRRTILIDYLLFGDHSWSKKMITAFLCPSRHLQREAEKRRLVPALHVPYFYTARVKSTHVPKTAQLLFVGRLEKIKGVEFLLRALPQILATVPHTELTIIGDGPEDKQLKELTRTLCVTNAVRFLGWIPNEEIADYYQQASAVVIPSIYPEVNPLVALEAMEAGVPIVAYRSGGLPEMVEHKVSGLLVETFSIPSLADACIRLCADPLYARALGKAGRELLEQRYTKKQHIDRLMAIYDSSIKVRAVPQNSRINF